MMLRLVAVQARPCPCSHSVQRTARPRSRRPGPLYLPACPKDTAGLGLAASAQHPGDAQALGTRPPSPGIRGPARRRGKKSGPAAGCVTPCTAGGHGPDLAPDTSQPPRKIGRDATGSHTDLARFVSAMIARAGTMSGWQGELQPLLRSIHQTSPTLGTELELARDPTRVAARLKGRRHGPVMMAGAELLIYQLACISRKRQEQGQQASSPTTISAEAPPPPSD